MALEGSVSTDKYGARYYKVTWEATQTVSTNKSKITWKLYAKGGDDSWYAERTLKVVVAGKTVFSKTERKERYTGLIDSGTVTVTHADDGTKSFSISIKAAVYGSSVNCTASKTFTLNKIARASTISALTSPVTLGNVCNVTFTPKSSSFYYKVKYVVGDWNIVKNVGCPGSTSSYTYKDYTIPLTVANQITKSTSATMTVYLYTYSNSTYETQIGSASSDTTTVNVPSEIRPSISSFTAEIVNTNDTIKNWGIAVSGYTKINFTGSGSGTYGSTISNFVISGGLSKTISGDSLSYTSDVITDSGTLSFEALCKDTRSRDSEKLSSQSIEFYSYTSPNILSFSATRSSTDSTRIIVSANWESSSVNNLNATTAIIQYKKPSEGESAWKDSDKIDKNTSTILTTNFEETSSYNIRVLVQDSISTPVVAEMFVPTKEVLLNFKSGGKGLGIGKICENDGLEVAFDASFEKNVNILGNIYASNLGRNTYSGIELITDIGYLSTSGNHSIRFYVIKPFNLVFVRIYIEGFSSVISASKDVFITCKIDERFRPAYNTPLSCFSFNNTEAIINTNGELKLRPLEGFTTSSTLYLGGLYPLNSSSELFI